MTPGSTLAVLFLVSLIPGWIFLRATQRSRLPHAQSALEESLELLAVGTATTGLSAVLLVLWAPGLAMDAAAPGTPHELRSAVALGLVVLGTASGLALIAAHMYSRIYPVRYGSSVWHEVLSDRYVPSGQLNFLGVETHDDKLYEGVQHSFTHGSEDAHRDVALKAPIYAYNNKGRRILTPYSLLVIPGDVVRRIAVLRMPTSPPISVTDDPRP